MNAVLLTIFRVLEVLFFAGVIGSLLVVVVTTIEDFGEIFTKDEAATGTVTAQASPLTDEEPLPNPQ